MVESLRQKIVEQAKTSLEIVHYLRNSIGDAQKIAEKEEWISKNVVCGLLDKAIGQIKAKIVEVEKEDSEYSEFSLGNAPKALEWVLAILGAEAEEKSEGVT